jgi:hypothetical protein
MLFNTKYMSIVRMNVAHSQELNVFDRLSYGFDSNTQFTSWKTKQSDQRGYQLYSSVQGTAKALRGDIVELDLGIKSGCIQSRSTVTGFGGGVSTLTDTVVQMQATYKGFGAFTPFATFAMNMPTGLSTLRGNERRGVMDKDLVFHTRFGEGFNFNPGIGFTYALSPELIYNFGIGYNARGAYTPNGDTLTVLKPGNQVIATSGLTYRVKDYSLGINASATYEKVSLNDSEKNFKPGNSYTLGVNASRNWNDIQSTSLSANYTYTAKNTSYDFFLGAFLKEAQNSNSSVISASLQHDYRINNAVGVFGRATYLKRDKNLYDQISDQYVSAKTKIGGELGTNISISQNASLNASVGLFRLRQNQTPYSPALLSSGLQGSLGVRVGF